MYQNFQMSRHFVREPASLPSALVAAFFVATATLGPLGLAQDTSIGPAPSEPVHAADAAESRPSDGPVYWKQYVFSIPYQVNRKSTDPDAPAEVLLLLSVDQGQKWAEASRVRPDVRGFTYYAPRDGEYWFSLQTVDRNGKTWPANEEKRTLRVVVDTHPPKLLLWADATPSGSVAVKWEVSDEHLAPSSLRIEMQTDADSAWRVVESNKPGSDASRAEPTSVASRANASVDARDAKPGNPSAGRTLVAPSPDATTVRFRATVTDLAGNLSETSAEVSVTDRPERTAMLPGSELAGGMLSGSHQTDRIKAVRQSAGPTATGPVGHASENRSQLFTAPSSTLPNRTAEVGQPAGVEPWPADTIVTGRINQSTTTKPEAISIDNPFVRGGPNVVDPPVEPRSDSERSGAGNPVLPPLLSALPAVGPNAAATEARVAVNNLPSGRRPSRAFEHRPTWQTLPASGQPINSAVQNDRPAAVRSPVAPPPMPGRQAIQSQEGPLQRSHARQPIQRSAAPSAGGQNLDASMVNSRSFSIEYEVQSVGSRGVGRVELWGTTDNGATWRRYGTDPDHRSPMEVAVEGEGEYGFRIVVHAAGSYGSVPPRPGDSPDVRVRVDLKTPTVSIGSVQKGRGNQLDQLTVRWTADDEHLTANPISLLFAAHPAGPWTTIATQLDNTGYYTWRLGDYIPEQLFLRVEARDAAGNVGAFSTAEAVVFERRSPTGRIQGVRANGGG